MSLMSNPILFHHLMDQHGLLDDIYKAVSAMDMSAAVLSALRALSITRTFPQVKNNEKNSDRSYIYRIEGNTLFTRGCYQKALEWYNKALSNAPKSSIELLYAYSNRSALLFKLTAYAASLNDIETCFKLGCTGDLMKKLSKRREECEKFMWKEHLTAGILKSAFTKDFFKFNVKRHSDISCLSVDVDIVSESGQKKVVAAKDIKVGTLLALETAFTTQSHRTMSYLMCYYCQKMIFNLIPCDNCCFALFCTEKCRDCCLREYHQVECQIMDVLETLDAGYKFRLTVKTVLKLKTQCKLWSTLIEESKNIGTSRLSTSTINQIYDAKNYAAMFNFEGEKHFIHGPFYNNCFMIATVIHHLQEICGFFPLSPKDCLEAKKCFAKLLMTFSLMWPYTTEIVNSAEELAVGQIVIDEPLRFGWFSFTSKLKHSCEPNVLVLGLDNRVGLVAIQPIKRMSEIKVSYVGHWYQHLYENLRIIKVFHCTSMACTCRVCKESWGIDSFTHSNLTHLQKEAYHTWDQMRRNMMLPQRESVFFKETCNALTSFQDLVNTNEHYEIFRELRTQLSLCQFSETNNTIINRIF